jgi:hypothetical protein
MSARDESGRRKVRLMTVWVGIGIALMVLGVVTSVWISLAGACIIGSTPVWFTLRGALSPTRPPERPPDPVDVRARALKRAPAARPHSRRRLRDHG